MADNQTHNGVPLDVTPNPPIPPKFKEGEPIADKIAKEEGDEYWENYAREIELEKKIAEIGGMEKLASGEIPLPEPIAKEMGLVKEEPKEIPVSKNTDFNVRGVALTDEQLGIGVTKPTSSGLRWLVEWFIYQLLKAHFAVKKVRGKILRYHP